MFKMYNKDLEYRTNLFNNLYPTSKAVYTASQDLENEFSNAIIEKIDTENYIYLVTSKLPKIFSKTSKTGKTYDLYMWKFDNVEKAVFVPEFKNFVISNKYKKLMLNLLILDKKYVDVKNIENAALGDDDFLEIDNIKFFEDWNLTPCELATNVK